MLQLVGVVGMGSSPLNLIRAGFFHFGKDHHKPPLEMLKTALTVAVERFGNLADTLIVLPEAFNIDKRHYYVAEETVNYDPSFLDGLKELSAIFKCAFIAGLIIRDSSGIIPPYSSAALIDMSVPPPNCGVLTLKTKKDGSSKYTPYHEFYSTPLVWRDLGIVALICLDAQSDQENHEHFRRRFQQLGDAFRSLKCRTSVVCIPMHMSNGMGGGDAGAKLTARYGLSESVWIAANSHTAVNSFVADIDGVIREPVGKGEENKIEVFVLANLIRRSELQTRFGSAEAAPEP